MIYNKGTMKQSNNYIDTQYYQKAFCYDEEPVKFFIVRN